MRASSAGVVLGAGAHRDTSPACNLPSSTSVCQAQVSVPGASSSAAVFSSNTIPLVGKWVSIRPAATANSMFPVMGTAASVSRVQSIQHARAYHKPMTTTVPVGRNFSRTVPTISGAVPSAALHSDSRTRPTCVSSRQGMRGNQMPKPARSNSAGSTPHRRNLIAQPTVIRRGMRGQAIFRQRAVASRRNRATLHISSRRQQHPGLIVHQRGALPIRHQTVRARNDSSPVSFPTVVTNPQPLPIVSSNISTGARHMATVTSDVNVLVHQQSTFVAQNCTHPTGIDNSFVSASATSSSDNFASGATSLAMAPSTAPRSSNTCGLTSCVSVPLVSAIQTPPVTSSGDLPDLVYSSMVRSSSVQSSGLTSQLSPFSHGSRTQLLHSSGRQCHLNNTSVQSLHLRRRPRRQTLDKCCSRMCCVDCMTMVTTFKWLLVGIAMIGVCCVLAGITLGTLHINGSSFLTMSLMFIGLGVLVVIVVVVGWRITPEDHEPCHLLLSLGAYSARGSESRRRLRMLRSQTWHGGL